MAGPWERYADQSSASADGPWARYSQQSVALQPQAEPAKPAGAPVSVPDAVVRGTLQGGTFNFYDELKGLAAAGGAEEGPEFPGGGRRQGIDHLIMGLAKYWFGDKDAQKKYDEVVGRERAETKRVEEERPGSYLAGNVAGAVAVPVGGAMNAATLPARMGRSALIGAGTGALAGVGEGEGAADSASRAATGAVIGGVVGGVAPPILEGAGRVVRAGADRVVNAVRGAINPEAEASRRAATAIERDMRVDPQAEARLAPQEFLAARNEGAPVTNMDLGGNLTRRLADSANITSPEGGAALNRTINQRFETQGDRLTDWMRGTFHYPDAHAQQEAIESVARTVNRTNYARAHADPRAGAMWDEGFEQLMQAPVMQEAARKATLTGANRAANQGFTPVRRPFEFHDADSLTPRYSRRTDAEGNTIAPNLEFWDHVKRNLDDKINSLQRAGENSAARDAQQLRANLVNHLDELVPTYRAARAGAASFFNAENALEAGQNFVGAAERYGLPQARQALARMSPQERQLFQDGYVSRFIETIEKTGDRRNVLNKINQSTAARRELETALGPQRWRELEARLRLEEVMDLPRSMVQGNSWTARRLYDMGLAGGAGLGVTGGYNSDPQQMMYGGLLAALASGGKRIDQNVARHVATLLTSNDPTRLQRGIQIIARSNQFMEALRRFDPGIARIAGGQQGGMTLPTMQAAGVGRADEQQPNVPRPPGQ